MSKSSKSDAEWQQELTEEQFNICRLKGTERPFTGKYWDCHEDGTYHCACCGEKLFNSETKFDSGSGWPSFYDVIDKTTVKIKEDLSHGMRRLEVMCAKCDAHLGHVFPDGPKPTGQRYCINSASLKLEPSKK